MHVGRTIPSEGRVGTGPVGGTGGAPGPCQPQPDEALVPSAKTTTVSPWQACSVHGGLTARIEIEEIAGPPGMAMSSASRMSAGQWPAGMPVHAIAGPGVATSPQPETARLTVAATQAARSRDGNPVMASSPDRSTDEMETREPAATLRHGHEAGCERPTCRARAGPSSVG